MQESTEISLSDCCDWWILNRPDSIYLLRITADESEAFIGSRLSEALDALSCMYRFETLFVDHE